MKRIPCPGHASKQLEVSGGGSYARWSAGGIEMGTAGPCTVRSSMWSLIRPANVPLPALPQAVEGSGDLVLNVGQQAGSTRLLAGEPYELLEGSSVVATGVTDDLGRLLIKGHEEGSPSYTVRLADGGEFRVPVSARPEPASHLTRRGYRSDDSAADRATSHGLSD